MWKKEGTEKREVEGSPRVVSKKESVENEWLRLSNSLLVHVAAVVHLHKCLEWCWDAKVTEDRSFYTPDFIACR